jgi:TonB family protein
MNAALLYRQRSRSLFWIAFLTAVAIHVGAVALAKTKSPIAVQEYLTPFREVDVRDAPDPEPVAPDESVRPPPLEQIHPDEEIFRDENYAPPTARAHRTIRATSLVRGTTTASLRSVRVMLTYAPHPVYPYEARRQRLTGSGIALLSVDQTSGAVTDVVMKQSCGSSILDNSTLDALRRWRFKAGNVSKIQVPITYTLMGASY